MRASWKRLFEGLGEKPGRHEFNMVVPDMNGIGIRCTVRYDRECTGSTIRISNVQVLCEGREVTYYQAVQRQFSNIEAKCMDHAEHTLGLADRLLKSLGATG